jgi:3-oxo-5-alpha-steroid 4-dehydrogenase 1
MSLSVLQTVVWCWIAVALVVHVAMFYVTAPFGRHTTESWGPTINNKLGWMLMEAPSLLIMAGFLGWGTYSRSSLVWLLFALWILHYINRTLVYPLRIRATPKRMPLVIALSAVFFNVVNAGLNGYYLAELAPPERYGAAWLQTPSFVVGAVLFAAGMAINWWSDTILIRLRRPGETGYKIPRGFLFEYVASPNLFGEIVEWIGFALMAWNLPALSFAVWTLANLVPRAKNHYDWYRRTFPDFPKDRKVVVPWVY